MEDRQKKRTLIGLAILGLVVLVGLSIWSLSLTIIDFNTKDLLNWILSNFGITGLSIYLKLLVNKKHEKKITAIVKGGTMKKNEKEFKFSQDFEHKIKDVKIMKKNSKLTFEFVGKNKEEMESQLVYAFGELQSMYKKE